MLAFLGFPWPDRGFRSWTSTHVSAWTSTEHPAPKLQDNKSLWPALSFLTAFVRLLLILQGHVEAWVDGAVLVIWAGFRNSGLEGGGKAVVHCNSLQCKPCSVVPPQSPQASGLQHSRTRGSSEA